MSMRDLIAVAQAKRREANLQGHSNDRISGLLSSPAAFCERSPSPLSEMQPISDLNLNEKVGGESVSSAYATEEHEPIASPEIFPVDVRNDATEASVARDALEGMLETLSKTRESIGRATRLAINCAQYGIFNEVWCCLFLSCGILSSFSLFVPSMSCDIFHFHTLSLGRYLFSFNKIIIFFDA